MKSLQDLLNEIKPHIKEVGLEEAETLIQHEYKILDVREPFEFENGHIPGSINIPRGTLESAADLEYPKSIPELRDHRDSNWLVVCRTGSRSAFACYTLQLMGFKNVVNLADGVLGWKKSNRDIVK